MNDTSRTNFSVNIEGGAVAVTSHLYASDSDSDSDSDDESEGGEVDEGKEDEEDECI